MAKIRCLSVHRREECVMCGYWQASAEMWFLVPPSGLKIDAFCEVCFEELFANATVGVQSRMDVESG